MVKHLFHIKWQGEQFEEKVQNMRATEAMLVMDFGMNIAHRMQDELEEAHWNLKQSTVHPMVTYYPCPRKNCDMVVTNETVMISPEQRHKYQTVRTFEKKWWQLLKSLQIPIKVLLEWSNNSSGQYKSYRPFDALSRSRIPMMWNFIGEKHCKSATDEVNGRLVQSIESEVRLGKADIQDAANLYMWAKVNLEIKGDPDTCCHYQRRFCHVQENDYSMLSTAQTLHSKCALHSMRNCNSAGLVEYCDSSCLCDFCLYGIGDNCPNIDSLPVWQNRDLLNNVIVSNLENPAWPVT